MDTAYNVLKVIRYINQQGLRVICRRNPREADGSYWPPIFGCFGMIVVDLTDSSNSDVLAILAHEYGHHLDKPSLRDQGFLILCNLGYLMENVRGLKFLSRWLTQISISSVIAREIVAWDLGWQFLRERHIEITYDMQLKRERCIRSYQSCVEGVG